MLVGWTSVCHLPSTALDMQALLRSPSWGCPACKEAIYIEGFTYNYLYGYVCLNLGFAPFFHVDVHPQALGY